MPSAAQPVQSYLRRAREPTLADRSAASNRVGGMLDGGRPLRRSNRSYGAHGCVLASLMVREASGRRFLLLLLEGLQVSLSLFQELFQSGAATETVARSLRPHAHPVLSRALEREQVLLQEPRNRMDHQVFEQIAIARPEVGQRVVVHTHAPADPHVSESLLGQLIELSRRADALGWWRTTRGRTGSGDRSGAARRWPPWP